MESVRTKEIIELLKRKYPDAHCELEYDSNYHLLIAVMLSARCTDKRVNKITRELFKVYNTPHDFMNADILELEKLIYSCGFFRAKANSIISASKDIVEKFNGELPSTMEELLKLKGVGRKTANVMLSVAFNKENIAVDTHVFRVSNRLGFSSGNTPAKVEKDLMELVETERGLLHHLLIFHGRYTCKSQNPMCGDCELSAYCNYKKIDFRG